MARVVYENDMFQVTVVTFVDPVLNETVDGYGIVNKQTNVREAECRRLFTAGALADGFQDQHRHPEKYAVQYDGTDTDPITYVAH